MRLQSQVSHGGVKLHNSSTKETILLFFCFFSVSPLGSVESQMGLKQVQTDESIGECSALQQVKQLCRNHCCVSSAGCVEDVQKQSWSPSCVSGLALFQSLTLQPDKPPCSENPEKTRLDSSNYVFIKNAECLFNTQMR